MMQPNQDSIPWKNPPNSEVLTHNLLLGDAVSVVAGGVIGVIEDFDGEEVLVKYYWGQSYWYHCSKVFRTSLPPTT